MNLKTLLFALFAITAITKGFSQDSAYYHTAFNSQDDTLKTRLYNIIKGHTEFPYTSSSTDVWDILKDTDKDTVNPDNVILLYSNRSVNGPQEYNSASGWNREHVWAKSRGDFGTSKGAGTDVHHLRPCDISVNSTRNNRNFVECATCVDVIDNGFNTGSKRDANLWTFEPPNNVKGDVARMIFYMAVRYEGEGSEPDLELTETLQSNTSKLPLHATLSTLLAWNRIDPVSDWERNRNIVIYGYQGNKNPFIDYPELAEHIWGNDTGVVWKPASTVGLDEFSLADLEIFPNPSTGIFTVRSFNNIQHISVTNILGQVVFSTQIKNHETTLDLNDQPKGLYVVWVELNNEIITKKIILTK